jgi:portal protein
VRFEQEANRKLLNRSAPGARRPFLKINTAAIVRANLEAQYRAFALGRQWGWLSVNDIRRLIDMEPIGPEGDVYLQPMNMTPIREASSDDDQRQQQREDDRRNVASLRELRRLAGR